MTGLIIDRPKSDLTIHFGDLHISGARYLEVFNNEDSLIIYRFDSPINGRFYLSRDYIEETNDMGFQDYPYLLKLLHEQQGVYVEKSSQLPTIVHTGLILYKDLKDDILPGQYLYLENDPNQETLFKKQYAIIPHVYRLGGTCKSSANIAVQRNQNGH